MFNVLRVFLYLSFVIGLLGLGNTMIVSVLQRGREIGMLIDVAEDADVAAVASDLRRRLHADDRPGTR